MKIIASAPVAQTMHAAAYSALPSPVPLASTAVPSPVPLASTAVACMVGMCLCGVLKARSRKLELEERALRKRQQRDAKPFPVLHGAKRLLPDAERRVLCATATELREMMRRREVSSEEVVSTFCRRAYEIGSWRTGGGSALNCVTEENYDDAILAARALDATATQEDWDDLDDKPLLGVPISVKDQVKQVGFDATMGMAVRCNEWGMEGSPTDSVVLAAMRDAGAIPFVRSNTSQVCMLCESTNNVWGESRNPYNPLRTVGGSSGGEAGLIAARCSPLGIGSDIGGSVRIPAHCCGVYALKPTVERMTAKGMGVPRTGERNGQLTIKSVVGPMANSVEDLAVAMRVWFSPALREKDPMLPKQPFDRAIYAGIAAAGVPTTPSGRKALRFAYVEDDGWFTPAASCKRGLREAVEALRAAGHVVESLEVPQHIAGWEAARLYVRVLGADGNMKGFNDALEGERMHPLYDSLKMITDIPNVLRPLIRGVLGCIGERRKRQLLSCAESGGLSVRDFYETVADLQQLRSEWLDLLGGVGGGGKQGASFDLLLLPGLGLPAFAHGESKILHQSACYCFLTNSLGWPTGSCPVTRVRDNETTYSLDELPENQRDSIASLAGRSINGSAGLPISVQVAGRPFEDELVLYGMRELERAVGKPPMPDSVARALRSGDAVA